MGLGSRFFFKKVRPTLGFRRFGQVPGLLVRWSLGPLVPWSLVPWSSGPWVLWVFDTLFRGLLEIVPSCRQSVCKLGGRRPPQPRASCTRPRTSIILPAKTEPIWPLSEPVIKTSCVQMGGGGGAAPPPNPPVFVNTVQAFFQEHCITSKTCFARIIVIDLFKYHRAGSLFANGGAAFPPTPGLAKTEAIWNFSTPHAGSLFANGGATSPPTPALF